MDVVPDLPAFKVTVDSLSPDNLVSACEQALAWVATLAGNLRSHYQLCLQRSEAGNTWELSVRVSVESLFWLLRAKNRPTTQLVSYADGVLASPAAYRDEIHPRVVPSIPTQYCKDGSSCKKQTYCKFGEHRPVCNRSIHDTKEQLCKFYIRDELRLSKLTGAIDTDVFALMLRDNADCDILVVVDPASKTNFKPHINSELVTSVDAWDAVLRTIRHLGKISGFRGHEWNAVERVVVNFGAWESAVSWGVNAIDCHGHVHIHPNVAAMKALATYEDNSMRDAIVARLHAPRHDEMFDCRSVYAALNTSQLQGDMSQLQGDMSQLRDDMSQLRDDMHRMNGMLERIAKALGIEEKKADEKTDTRQKENTEHESNE